MRRLAPLALVWTFLALALGVAAAGAAPPASLPDGPALSVMALGPNDFASARVVAQGHQPPDGAVDAYARDFASGSRAGRTPLIAATNYVALHASEADARAEVAAARLALGSARGRADFAKSFTTGFTQGSKLKVTKVTVSRPTSLGIGVDSLRWGIAFKTRVGRIHVAFAFVRLDRAVGTIILVARPGRMVAVGDMKRLGLAQRNRFRAGFTITDRGGPAVTGLATLGSTLTSDRGRWNGGPSEVAYQWSRCSAGTCTPIAGAVGQTYVVTPEDAGSTLKVTVTAKNSVSSASADSAESAAVA